MSGPLTGVRVIDLTSVILGPYATQILGDLGADVIKIEHPEAGDTARGQANNGSTFYTYNRNKTYLALDLRQDKGKDIFAQLVARADVVLDNFAPGALDRLGLNYEWGRAVNPRIIYCSIKGFLPGPSGDRPFLDELAQMEGGLAFLTGFKDQPMRAGASITDIGAATYGVVGILAALLRRHQTGEGDHIEAGLYETIVFWISQHITRAQMTGGNAPSRDKNNSAMGSAMGWGVYQLFPTSTGKQVFIAVTSNRTWSGLCGALGFEDWKDAVEFNSNRKRAVERQRLVERIGKAVETLSYDEIAARLYKWRVPFAPVNSPRDLVDDEHLNRGNRWLNLSVPGYQLKVPKVPFHMERTPDFDVRQQPACLGEHTDIILEELGYSPADIAALKKENVVLRSNRMLEEHQDD
jgi:crotonobetainyl-CoA:carnitine CoA-transferase CaiB-like acyl-CoA transferase